MEQILANPTWWSLGIVVILGAITAPAVYYLVYMKWGLLSLALAVLILGILPILMGIELPLGFSIITAYSYFAILPAWYQYCVCFVIGYGWGIIFPLIYMTYGV